MTDQARRKVKLSRERIVDAAITLADRSGIEALTMRALADHLGTRPMTLYHHVDGKETLLDWMVDRVFAQMDLPSPELAWIEALRERCRSTRAVLIQHPWSVPLLESRTSPGPELLRHHEAMLDTLDRGGLSLDRMAHAYAILDSYVYGFSLQEASLPAQGGEGMADVASAVVAAFASGEYPQLARLTAEHVMRPGYSFGSSFDVGLDMLLTAIAAGAEGAGRGPAHGAAGRSQH